MSINLSKLDSAFPIIIPPCDWNKITCILFLFLFSIVSVSGQNRSKLETKRKNLNKRIELTTDLLKETRASRSKAISDFETINKQIENRNELIEVLEEELAFTDSLVIEQEQIVTVTQSELDSLQLEYGDMMREALRQKLQESRLQFILSGSSLTEYYNRWRFLKTYQENRKRQLEMILEKKINLEGELAELKILFDDKEALFKTEQYQNELLNIDLSLQTNTLKALKNDEASLRKALRVQEQNKRELDKNIQSVISSGIARAKRKKESSTIIGSNTVTSTTIGSGAFGKARGKLSWPVHQGVIVKKFGTQPHPTLKGISISNNGIDIRSQPGSEVKAVFEGEVLQSQQVSGSANILVIGHGNYYTVYANLAQINVSIGDTITMGQTIGYLNSDASKVADLHFEIWKEKQRLNPIKWISR